MASRAGQSDVTSASALVVAADEEMRILLRGLLQLHRVRVDAEAAGMTEALRFLREHRPGLVVADSRLSEGTPCELVSAAREVVPCLRFVLVTTASSPPLAPEKEGRPDVVLVKPFRIQQFAEAIAPGAAGPAG